MRFFLVVFAVVTAFSSAQAGFFDIFKRDKDKLEKQAPVLNKGTVWELKKLEWTEQDEKNYSSFVRAIGRSGCRTVDSCLRGEWNPFRSTDPKPGTYTFWSDCADWPYFLRSYFAWKNGLPFVYSHSMRSLPLTPEQLEKIKAEGKEPRTDVRYSENGNAPGGQIAVPQVGKVDFFQFHGRLQDLVHTATFRVDPRLNTNELYAAEVTRRGIRPGTAVYDPSGHVGVVFDVTDNGQVMVFDAYIDRKSISQRRPYSSNYYKRSKIAHGAWFANFRPIKVVGAEKSFWGKTFTGGKYVLAKNEEIKDFSLEQFGTPGEKSGYYNINGRKMEFQEFLRRRMFKGSEYKIDVVSEFKEKVQTICGEFQARVKYVQTAIDQNVIQQPHIERLPETIFGGDGVWDLISTPGGDVRIKYTVNDIMGWAAATQAKLRSGGKTEYSYNGADLKADLVKAVKDVYATCSVSYKNTNGEVVNLGLRKALQRINQMSFSPYHCPELRWGATDSQELSSCRDLRDQTKKRWYEAQRTMRNWEARDTSIFTGYTLEELEAKASSLGPASPIRSYEFVERLQQM